jgi:hypothetical protein
MLPFPQMKGFLGTGATFGADLNLVAQLVMGVALLMGGLLARTKAVRSSWGLPGDRAAPEFVDDRIGHVAVISPAGRADISESVPQTLFHCSHNSWRPGDGS